MYKVKNEPLFSYTRDGETIIIEYLRNGCAVILIMNIGDFICCFTFKETENGQCQLFLCMLKPPKPLTSTTLT